MNQISSKTGLGYILAEFLTNSFGHPVAVLAQLCRKALLIDEAT
jgi:hypothetical protein